VNPPTRRTEGKPRGIPAEGSGPNFILELAEEDAVIAELLAWCGAALSCLLCLPQALRTLRDAERLDGISPGTYWIVLANATVWVTWSLVTGELAVGAPALINGPAAVLILHRLAVARPRNRTASGYRGPSVPSASGTMSR
jgi:uncharacterized protein with PQ loop repeat